nr:hypothetical protein [uncultured Nocardioides sp.]
MHVRRALALTLAVPALLVGCSDDPEPKPKIPETTSSSPTPTPTDSVTPEAESPEDFIRRWVEAGDEMQVTGETAEYDGMSPNCKACQGFVDSVEEVYDAGGSAEFAGTRITGIKRYASDPPTYDVSQRVPETTIRRGDSGETQTLPGGSTRIRVILKKSGADWQVTYFGILS